MKNIGKYLLYALGLIALVIIGFELLSVMYVVLSGRSLPAEHYMIPFECIGTLAKIVWVILPWILYIAIPVAIIIGAIAFAEQQTERLDLYIDKYYKVEGKKMSPKELFRHEILGWYIDRLIDLDRLMH